MSDSRLLAVDVGLRSGLAYFEQGRLQWYTSRHFANLACLRRGIRAFLGQLPQLDLVVVEGDGHLARFWKKAAEGRGLGYCWVSAETWREELMSQRQRRTGVVAKEWALELAREPIFEAGLPRPQKLRHDTAEAILVGVWFIQRQPGGNL